MEEGASVIRQGVVPRELIPGTKERKKLVVSQNPHYTHE